MDSGSSRELLELWAPEPRNGLIITGYSVEGTLAKVRCRTVVVFVGMCILLVMQCTLFDSARVIPHLTPLIRRASSTSPTTSRR